MDAKCDSTLFDMSLDAWIILDYLRVPGLYFLILIIQESTKHIGEDKLTD